MTPFPNGVSATRVFNPVRKSIPLRGEGEQDFFVGVDIFLGILVLYILSRYAFTFSWQATATLEWAVTIAPHMEVDSEEARTLARAFLTTPSPNTTGRGGE